MITGRSRPISSAVVLGGGIVAWSVAAAIRRRLPQISVEVIPLSPPPEALADRICSTLPSIVDFHQDLGLTDADTIVRAGSSYRFGAFFEGWVDGAAPYIHSYAAHGMPFGAAAFHQYWLAAESAGHAAAFEDYSVAAAAARCGRFVDPNTVPATVPAPIGFGLRIDPSTYVQMMRAFALHLGAREWRGTFRGPRLNGETGFVEAIALGDADDVVGDLFIDATGPAALLRRAMDDAWQDWSRWLPCDRILFATAAPRAEPSLLDRACAVATGWVWQSDGLASTTSALIYSSAYAEESLARDMLQRNAGVQELDSVCSLQPGRWSEPWLRNCVAIGDAAVAIEPLEWTNLHLAHSAIDRLVAMMPDQGFEPVELWDYNRQTASEADRVRDFVVLHYATASRPTDEFWRDYGSRDLPDSLMHSMAQFRERGRLPFYEEETFSRDSWLAVLLGQGVRPKRVDPLTDLVPRAEAENSMARMRQAIDALVRRSPSQQDYLRSLARKAA